MEGAGDAEARWEETAAAVRRYGDSAWTAMSPRMRLFARAEERERLSSQAAGGRTRSMVTGSTPLPSALSDSALPTAQFWRADAMHPNSTDSGDFGRGNGQVEVQTEPAGLPRELPPLADAHFQPRDHEQCPETPATPVRKQPPGAAVRMEGGATVATTPPAQVATNWTPLEPRLSPRQSPRQSPGLSPRLSEANSDLLEGRYAVHVHTRDGSEY